jgi:hypothetical protein
MQSGSGRTKSEFGWRSVLNRARCCVSSCRELRLALAGLALGLAGALALTRVVHSLLFEIKPADPTTFAVVTAVFLAVALIVCWVSGETSYPR